MPPTIYIVSAPGAEFEIEAYVSSREYADAAEARRAWEAAMLAGISDAGASRTRDQANPTGPGKFVVYMAFGEQAWEKLAPFAEGGKEWEPNLDFLAWLIRKRIKAAVMGKDSWVTRGSEWGDLG